MGVEKHPKATLCKALPLAGGVTIAVSASSWHHCKAPKTFERILEVKEGMNRPTADWKKSVSDFATTYFVPVVFMLVLVFVGLGFLGIAGVIIRHIVVPVIGILILLAIVSLLTAEMFWRLPTFNALLGLGFTYPAVIALTKEPLQAIVGIALGVLGVVSLHLYGDTMKASEQEKKTMTDVRGNQHQAVFLTKNEPDFMMLAGALSGIIAPLVCWSLKEHGLWSLFLGLYASLALGRAISWLSVEADTHAIYFWRPLAFLKQIPGFSHFFNWWHQVRHLIGIWLAHWAQE